MAELPSVTKATPPRLPSGDEAELAEAPSGATSAAAGEMCRGGHSGLEDTDLTECSSAGSTSPDSAPWQPKLSNLAMQLAAGAAKGSTFRQLGSSLGRSGENEGCAASPLPSARSACSLSAEVRLGGAGEPARSSSYVPKIIVAEGEWEVHVARTVERVQASSGPGSSPSGRARGMTRGMTRVEVMKPGMRSLGPGRLLASSGTGQPAPRAAAPRSGPGSGLRGGMGGASGGGAELLKSEPMTLKHSEGTVPEQYGKGSEAMGCPGLPADVVGPREQKASEAEALGVHWPLALEELVGKVVSSARDWWSTGGAAESEPAVHLSKATLNSAIDVVLDQRRTSTQASNPGSQRGHGADSTSEAAVLHAVEALLDAPRTDNVPTGGGSSRPPSRQAVQAYASIRAEVEKSAAAAALSAEGQHELQVSRLPADLGPVGWQTQSCPPLNRGMRRGASGAPLGLQRLAPPACHPSQSASRLDAQLACALREITRDVIRELEPSALAPGLEAAGKAPAPPPPSQAGASTDEALAARSPARGTEGAARAGRVCEAVGTDASRGPSFWVDDLAL
eukprot:CAMPEP_0179073150 /NCGR_PEP_ID=MMETSP0796-20121207/32423_1 /TAXON_ID=73915 /ORGANISM="Pyrodinium bahamense, Strain pbaha01" /LENGTH=564 /DNA_ID=CAMNT_0020770335 /DNA_START=27 /DNA_END=1722 /DNA_ORIENTATION=-